jgi:hypothetical protein
MALESGKPTVVGAEEEAEGDVVMAASESK